MLKRLTAILAASLVLLAVGGLVGLAVRGWHAPHGYFDGIVEFRNKSGEDLAWVKASGFPDGVLVKGGEAGSSLGRRRFAGSVTLTWRLQDGPEHETTILLKDISPSKRKGTLVFEFTAEKEWFAWFEE